MKPKTTKYSNRCGEGPSSNCVEWNGPSIPCLELCQGDSVTDIVHSIGTKVCDLADEMNLEELDLSCLINMCGECEDKTLKNILQLMLDNDCKLKDLIDNIVDQINAGSDIILNLNYKCLEVLDPFGNPVFQDINQTLQSLIDSVCDHSTILANHETRLAVIETTYCQEPCGGSGTGGYVSPTVTLPADCVPAPLPTMGADDATQYVINSLCDLKGTLGSNTELLAVLARQCANANSTYGLTPNWEQNPVNVADSISNMWIVLCDLMTRVKSIEDTCCAPTCADIKVNFEPVFDSSADLYTLYFTYGTGTFIPPGYEDCGSVIVFTDKNGRTKTFNITLENGLEWDVPNLAPLDITDEISVQIKSCLTHTSSGLVCKDCFGGVLDAYGDKCAFCTLKGIGTSGSVVIQYIMLGDFNNVATVTIPYNGQGFIPSDAQIISYSATGDAELEEQTCISMTTGTTECWEFEWVYEIEIGTNTTNRVDPMAMGIQLGSNFYPFRYNNNDIQLQALELVQNGNTGGIQPSTFYSGNVKDYINNGNYFFSAMCADDEIHDPVSGQNGPGRLRKNIVRIKLPSVMNVVPEIKMKQYIQDSLSNVDETFSYIKATKVDSANCDC